MRGISWLAVELLASQEGPPSMDTVRELVKDVGFLNPQPAMGLYRVTYEASNLRIGNNDMPINGRMMIMGGGVK